MRATLPTQHQSAGTDAKVSGAAARMTTDGSPGFLTAAQVCDALAVPSKCPLAYCARLARDGDSVRVMRGVYLASSVEQFKKRLAEAALLAARSRGGK